ncbi:unnamed protein product [Tilletia controversa]|nr:unnamed protein product [Tilletia controversa]CAD6923053.1 unnamed protein product [Tilletia controversa]CAD6923969.1 unnamed protein product [Tilletia controversa]CAD6978041.1 unnamed protein product [Tilletia controversa]
MSQSQNHYSSSSSSSSSNAHAELAHPHTGTSTPPTASTADLTTLGTKIVYQPITLAQALQNYNNDARLALEDIIASRNSINYDAAKLSNDNARLWGLVEKFRRENEALRARINSGSPAGSLPANTTTTATRGSPLTAASAPATAPPHRSHFDLTSLSASGSPVSSHTDTGITPKSRQYASADAASLAIAASHASLAQAVGMPNNNNNNNNKTLSEQEAAAAAAARAQNIMQQRMAAQAQAQALGGGAIPGLAASSAGPSSSSNSSQQHHSSGAGGSGPNQNTAQNFSSSGHSRNPAGTGLARGGESLYGRLSSESEGESFAAVDDSDAEHGSAQEAHPDAPKSGQAATGGSLGSIHSALGLSHDTVSQQQTPQQQPKMLHQHHQQQQQQQQQQAGNSRNMAGVGAGGNTSSPRRAPQQLPLSPRSRATGLPPDQHQHQYHQQHYDSPTSPPSNPYSAQAQASALLQAAAGVSSTSAGSPGGSSAASGGRHGRQRTQDIGQAIAQAAFLSSSSTAPRLDAATLTNSTAIHVPSSRLRVLERGRETVYFEISITILVPPAHWGPPPPSNAQGLLMGEYPPMKWTVEKTVSDLGGLDGRLRQKHGKSATKKLPELPDQSLFGDHAPSRVDQRKTVVETYLQKLLNLSLPDKDDICTFLCTDVARPRPVDPAALQKEGFLTKKGLNPGRWVTRYYCLRNPPSGTQPNGTSSTSAAGSDNKQPFRLDYYEYLGGPQIGSINIVGAEIGRQQRNTASDMDENSYRHAFLILERRPVTGPTNGELASSGTMNSLSSGYSGSTGATLTPGAGAAGSAAGTGTGTGTGNGSGTGSASTLTMQTVRHVLCAENDRERDEWVDVLVRAIDTAHRETTQSGSSSTSAAPSQSGHPSQQQQQQQHLQAAPVLGNNNNNNNSQASHPGSPQLNNAMSLASMDQGVQQQLPGSTSFAELSSPVSSSAATGSPAHHAWNPPSGAGSSATGSGSVSGPSGVGAGQRHGKNVPSSSSAGGQGQYASGAGPTYSPRGANTSLPSESGHGAGAGAVHGYAQNHGYGGGGGGGYGQASSQQTHGGYEVSAARMGGPGRSMSTDAGGSSEGGRVMSGTTASGSVGNLGHHETSSVSLVSSAATASGAAGGNNTSVSTPFRTNKAAISGPMNGTPIPQGYKFGGSSAASAARGVNAGSGSGGGGGGSNTAGGSGAGGGGPDDEVGERKEKESEKKRFWQGFRGFGNSDKDKNGNHSFGRGQQQQQQDAARPVFGVSLVDAIAVSSVSEGLGLPSVVYRCIEYLERKQAFKEEGIYRLSGSSAVIKSLKDRFNTVGDVDLLAPGVEYYDPHAVAGLLKTFLRELPESVLTRELHFEFLRVNDVPDRRDRVRELGRLVCMLPLANYSVLRTLCSHLIKIIQHADVNKMTMRNVGIVFSPTLAIPAGVFALLLTEFDYVFFTDATGLRAPMTIEDEEAHEAAVAAAAAAAEAAIQRQLSPPPGAAPNLSSPGGQQQQTGGLMAPGPRKAGRNPNRGSWIAGTTLHSGGDGATHQLAMQMAAAQEASSMPSPSQVQAAIAAAGSSSSSSGPGSAASGIGNGGTSLSASPSGQRSNRNSLSYNESDAERLLGLGGGMNGHNLVGQGLSALEISKAEEELGAMSSALMSAGSGSASSGSGGGDGGGRGHGHGHGHGQGHGQGNVMMMGGGMVAPPAGSGGESAEY